jgi:hypothetical protein
MEYSSLLFTDTIFQNYLKIFAESYLLINIKLIPINAQQQKKTKHFIKFKFLNGAKSRNRMKS